MPDLLIELLSEEIPARMQRQAAADLARLWSGALREAGLEPESLETFAGPRRLTLAAEGLPPRQADRTESRKGPRQDAPAAAVEGFLRSTGLRREDLQARDGVYFAELARPGRPTREVAREILEDVLRKFPWPKSMRSGVSSFRWVRPLKRILFVFDGEPVPFAFEGLEAGALSEGHRFLGPPGPFRATRLEDYRRELEARFVVLSADERRRRILESARGACAAAGLELVEDEGLLEEVAGLVEWPVPVLGAMEPRFLALPPEVVRTSMRTHQKYFAVRRPGETGLAPAFLAVANVEARDGGRAIARGNAKVLSARLQDAEFFWNEDLRTPLWRRLERLEGVTFHARLGSMGERARRLTRLCADLAPAFGVDPDLAAAAGRLAKADLVTGMVGEFPELQGLMGGYYLRAQGAPGVGGEEGPARAPLDAAAVAALADAVRDHYRPLGPSDAPPAAPLSVVLALADKLDLLVSFFSIGEKPTGSRDPFALRRAALGVIRILTASGVRVGLRRLLDAAAGAVPEDAHDALAARRAAVGEVEAFIAERLKVLLREDGRRHDLVDAVMAAEVDDLVEIVERIGALSDFLGGEAGAALLSGHRRAVNILKAEARKGALDLGGRVEAATDAPAAEAELLSALARAEAAIDPALAANDYRAAMTALSGLSGPVDRFFEAVLVNDPDPGVRARRLGLLERIRTASERIGDFSRISV